MSIPTIDRDALKSKMDRGGPFVLVETLSAGSYAQGHLPGAINLPPDQIAELAPTVLRDKAAEVIVYCADPT